MTVCDCEKGGTILKIRLHFESLKKYKIVIHSPDILFIISSNSYIYNESVNKLKDTVLRKLSKITSINFLEKRIIECFSVLELSFKSLF